MPPVNPLWRLSEFRALGSSGIQQHRIYRGPGAMLTQTLIHRGTSRQTAGRVNRPLPPVSAHTTGNSIELMGAPMPFARNAEIYGENEPAEYLYKVISGTVRTYKVLNDGRRQIGAFYLPGDFFGLEVGDEHTF